MTSWQRLLLGLGGGGLFALMLHPTSRALLLHTWHSGATAQVLMESQVSNDSIPLTPPPDAASLSNDKVLLIASSIARNVNKDPKAFVTAEGFSIAERFLSQAAKLDKDNAYWPQLLAALSHRAGKDSAADMHWRGATDKLFWTSGASRVSEQLGQRLSEGEGIVLSWQNLVAIKFRPDDAEQLISRYGETFFRLQKSRKRELEARTITLFNAGLLRDGTVNLGPGIVACKLSLNMINLAGREAAGTIIESEQMRDEFLRLVASEIGGDEATRARAEISRSIAYAALLPSENAIEQYQDRIRVSSLLTAATPSAALCTALIFLVVAFLGAAITNIFGNVPHPDRRIILVAGLLIAIGAFSLSRNWLFAIWWLFIVGVVMIPIETAKPDPIKWNATNRLAMALVTMISLVQLLVFVAAISPSMEIYRGQSSEFARLISNSALWGQLAAISISLAAPCAAAWAHLKKRSILHSLGETLRAVGLSGAIAGLLICAISAPICLYIDGILQPTTQIWLENEPKALQNNSL